jgi:endonuclease/exonuclease/phosphatase family metal-dependent hydrolase
VALVVALLAGGCIGAYRTTADLGDRACPAAAAAPAMGWYAPVGVRDRQALDAWCAGVGPSVIDTVPANPAIRVNGLDTLRVLVWNVSAGGGDLLGFLESEAGLRCGPGRTPAPPFVLLAQEAYRRSRDVPPGRPNIQISAPAAERRRAGRRADVTTIASHCGLALIYVPAVRNGREDFPDGREDRGNAVLANVPLHDPVVIELPPEDSRRLAVTATIRGGSGGSLRVVSLHFTLLPKLWRNLTTGNAARIRHALGMIDALERIEADRSDGTTAGLSTLAAGDANTWSADDAALQRLRLAFPESPAPLAEGTRGPFPADHVFFRRGSDEPTGKLLTGTYRRVASDYNSDHHPLVVTYRFGR